MQAQRSHWVGVLAVASGVLLLAQGSGAAVNLSGRWVARITGTRVSGASGSTTLKWDITDRGGRLFGFGGNRRYAFTGTGTAGGAVQLHFVFSDHTNDFIGTVGAKGRTMTGTWTGSRGARGTATVIRIGRQPRIGGRGALRAPRPGVAVNIQDGPGTTFVRSAGKEDFSTLEGGAQIAVGTELDTTTSTVALTSAEGKAEFTRGFFVVKEPRESATSRVTDVVLSAGDFTRCPKSTKRRMQALDQPIRQLWGSGKGNFRTTGKYASATVRGTRWRLIDRCNGTLIKVISGSVRVRDFKRKRIVIVTSGHTYLARR